MPTPSYGRRASHSNKASKKETGSGTLVPETVFTLALKPPDDPDYKASMQMLSNEFATRYLENIGVKPSKSTLDLVARSMPLTETCVKTTLRSKGHVNDEVKISMPPIAYRYRPPTVIKPHKVFLMNLNSKVSEGIVGLEAPQSQHDDEKQDHVEASMGGKHATLPSGPAGLLEIARLYLHPFNLDVPLTQQRVAGLMRGNRTGSSLPCQPAEELGGGAPLAHALSGMSAAWRDKETLTASVADELSQELLVTPEVILTIMSQLETALVGWFRSQAPETLKDRLTSDEFDLCIKLLTSDETIKLFITTIYLLHQQFIMSSPLYIAWGHPAAPQPCRSVASSRPVSAMSRGGVGASSVHSGFIPLSYLLERYDLGFAIRLEAISQRKSQENAAAQLNRKSVASRSRDVSKDLTRSSLMSLMRSQAPSRAETAKDLLGNLNGLAQLPTNHSASHEPPSATSPSIYNPHLQPPAHRISTNRPTTARSVQFQRASSETESLSSGEDLLTPFKTVTKQSLPGHIGLPMFGTEQVASRGSLREAGSQLPTPFSQASKTGMQPANSGPLHTSPNAPSKSSHLSVAVNWGARMADGSPQTSPSAQQRLIALAAARIELEEMSEDEMEELQADRLYAIHEVFAAIFKEQRRSRAGLFFTLPALLLAIRFCTTTLFSAVYPLWAGTAEGLDALADMDQAIVDVLDPSGYLRQGFSLLQSTPDAITAIHRNQTRAHEPVRNHMSDTSALVTLAMAQPRSVGARLILSKGQAARESRRGPAKTINAEPSGQLKAKLAPTQRDRLFKEAAAMLAVPDPNHARSLGEPLPEARDSWMAAAH